VADFDTQGTAPATPTAVDTSASSTQGQTAPQGATPPAIPTGGQSGTPPGATAGAPGEGWVPSYRLREQRDTFARQVAEREAALRAQYEAQIAESNKKIQALAGFGPQPNPEVDAVRQQFAQLYPGLARLDDKAVERLLQISEQFSDVEEQNNHYWQTYGQSKVNELFDLAKADIGTELTDAGKQRLHTALVGYVQSSPQNMAAYSRDPNFVKEFWKAWSSDFIEPVRRVSAASAQGRAGLPAVQDVPGQIRTQPAQQPGTLDERLAMSWNSYQQTRKP
jgi:hypothetical protein